MATIMLSYDTSDPIAASMIDAIRKSGVFKIEEINEKKCPYDPDFVEKIARSEKSRGKSIKTEDLWK